jgi:hypothetical protein
MPPERTTDGDVLRLAEDTRARLEPLWDEWRRERGRPDPETPSAGMCRFTAQLLARLLAEAGLGEWTVQGGSPHADYGPEAFRHLGAGEGGIIDPSGAWRGHYWAFRQADGTIADVTADQFGHGPVIVTSSDDPRYRANYRQASLRRHLLDASETPSRWAAAIARDGYAPSGPPAAPR